MTSAGAGKVLVHKTIRADGNKKLAFVLSREDAARTEITEEELCSFAWQARLDIL
jgi:hypothetical protein